MTHFKKGSSEAKAYMAYLRSLRGGRDCILDKARYDAAIAQINRKKISKMRKMMQYPYTLKNRKGVNVAKYYADKRLKRLPAFVRDVMRLRNFTEDDRYGFVENARTMQEGIAKLRQELASGDPENLKGIVYPQVVSKRKTSSKDLDDDGPELNRGDVMAEAANAITHYANEEEAERAYRERTTKPAKLFNLTKRDYFDVLKPKQHLEQIIALRNYRLNGDDYLMENPEDAAVTFDALLRVYEQFDRLKPETQQRVLKLLKKMCTSEKLKLLVGANRTDAMYGLYSNLMTIHTAVLNRAREVLGKED